MYNISKMSLANMSNNKEKYIYIYTFETHLKKYCGERKKKMRPLCYNTSEKEKKNNIVAGKYIYF